MTKTTTERLGILEERTKNIEDKLDKLISSFDGFVSKSENKFLTRLEAKVAGALISFAFAAISVWVSIKDHIKN